MHNDPMSFDHYAEDWDEDQRRWERSQAVAGQIVEHLWGEEPRCVEKPHTVELGAGTGMLSRCLAEHLGQSLLLDSSPQMVSVARSQITKEGLDNLQVELADLSEQDIPGAPYDLVLAQLFLHHLADLPEYLLHVREQMSPGAWLAAVEFDLDEEHPHMHGGDGHGHGHGHGHGEHAAGEGQGPVREHSGHSHGGHEINEFDRETFAGWLAETGFQNVHLADAGFMHTHDKNEPPHRLFLVLAQA